MQQRGIPLALAQQLGVGYAAPGTWPHPARDWRGGRVVFPHTTLEGYLVNLYGRAVGTAEQVPKAKRHDHLPGAKGYFNAAALQAGAGPLWVCEGAFDALALLAAGIARVVAIFGVQGWRWDWVREVRELVFALDADAAGQQQWRQLARQAALRGKAVAVLPAAAYGGYKDVNEAWAAGVLAVGAGPPVATVGSEGLAIPQHLREALGGAGRDHGDGRWRRARGSRAPGVGVAPDLRCSAVKPAWWPREGERDQRWLRSRSGNDRVNARRRWHRPRAFPILRTRGRQRAYGLTSPGMGKRDSLSRQTSRRRWRAHRIGRAYGIWLFFCGPAAIAA